MPGLDFFLGQWQPNPWVFPEEVTKVADGTFTVKWEDPDGGPEESEVDPKDIRRDSSEGTCTSGDLPSGHFTQRTGKSSFLIGKSW